jgi:hypothetical protein
MWYRLRSFVPVRAFVLILAMALSGCSSYWLLYPGMADSTDPHMDPMASGDRYELIAVTNANRISLKGWLFAAPGDRGTALILGDIRAEPLSDWSRLQGADLYLAGIRLQRRRGGARIAAR